MSTWGEVMALTITVHVHEKIGVIRPEKTENLTTKLVRFIVNRPLKRFIVNRPLKFDTGVSLLFGTQH
jgi:hypothetical protein